MEQITKLHKENTLLQSRYEEAAEELIQLRRDKEQLQDELFVTKETPFKVSINHTVVQFYLYRYIHLNCSSLYHMCDQFFIFSVHTCALRLLGGKSSHLCIA